MAVVQHIGFNCIDRVKQEEFYTRHFGFERARVFNRGQDNEFVMLRLGACCIELFGADEAEPQPSPGAQTVGFKHLAFEVDDLDAKVKEMEAEGLEPGDIIDCSGVVPGLRVCFLKDPEGNILELMQGWQDES
jgi:glyoxylase I family protein